MRPVAAIAVLLLGTTSLVAQPTVTIPLNGHNFTLPAGFTIEVAARSPLVERPITVAFDELGHLYVADSSGSNEKLVIQLEKKPHRIVRLDPAKDGVFTTGHVFADKMMFPEGTMWHKGSLYVAAPPSIWKLTDTTGNGIADQRSEWYQGKTLTNCGNDLHGPWLGPDGWFYWTRGGFAPQKHVFAGKEIETRASILFRAKPDGSQREPIIAGGMDNPVGLAFTPGGEPILTNTFLVYPSNGQRDGLIHAVYGGVYGKDFADVLAPHIRTSTKLMPVLEHLGPAAPTGIVRYDSDVFGKEYQDNMFVGQFNLRKVSRHVLTLKGATFESKSSDFVVSDNPDFHPTDVVMDADGSLLIVDTGGWYKLCCPTSQLVKPDVLGAIYRVRKVGAKGPEDPRGLKVDWKKVTPADLVQMLGDSRSAVRLRAKLSLVDLDTVAIEALRNHLSGRSAIAKTEAVWTLCAIEGTRSRDLIREFATSREEVVRQAALHGIALWRDASAAAKTIELLASPSLQNQRAASEALGRIRPGYLHDRRQVGDEYMAELKRGIDASMMNFSRSNDPFLNHSIVHSLIEIDEAGLLDTYLSNKSSKVRAGAITAIGQMDRSNYHLELGPLLLAVKDADPELRATGWTTAERVGVIELLLVLSVVERRFEKMAPEERVETIAMLAKYADLEYVAEVMPRHLREASDAEAKLLLIAMRESKARVSPRPWIDAIQIAIERPSLEFDAVFTLRALRFPENASIVASLEALANDRTRSATIRLGAIAANPKKSRTLSSELFSLVCEQLDADAHSFRRSLAAEILSRSRLTFDQLVLIAETIPKVGPLEVDRLLELFAGQKDDAVGARLMDSMEQPKLAASLRVDSLERRLKNFGPAVQERAAKLYARLNADLAGQRSHLEELLTKLPAGDVRRGQAVFNRAKSACTACHTIGYVGGKVGPDLTRVGSIRTRRDLLEAVVYPSASFVRGYEPIVIVTTDGKTHNGLVRSENADEITLTTGPNQEERIAQEIESMQPSRVSVMPAGLEQQMSTLDLADLVAFLGACR